MGYRFINIVEEVFFCLKKKKEHRQKENNVASTNSQKVVLVLLSVILCLCLVQLTATFVFVHGSRRAHKPMRYPHKANAKTKKAEQSTENQVAAVAEKIEQMLEEFNTKEDYSITIPLGQWKGSSTWKSRPTEVKFELGDEQRQKVSSLVESLQHWNNLSLEERKDLATEVKSQCIDIACKVLDLSLSYEFIEKNRDDLLLQLKLLLQQADMSILEKNDN